MAELISAGARWVLPLFLVGIPLYGYVRRVDVYAAFVEGAQGGFWTAIKIIPFMVAILTALSVFRASGAMDAFIKALTPVGRLIHLPGEVIPLLILRPLSGSASLAYSADLMRMFGPDSLIGLLGSAVQGSTDTTFFVLTVYFGSVGVRNVRYSVAVGLMGDVVGFAAALVAAKLLFP